MGLTRRSFLGALALAPVAVACAKQSTVGAPTYLTSAQGMAGIPSLPMLLAQHSSRDVDRITTRLRAVLAPLEQERRALLDVLADGALAGKIDKPACDAAIEKIEAAGDKAAPALRDAVLELHRSLEKKERARTVDAVAQRLGTVDDEPEWIRNEEFRVTAAELELRGAKQWSAMRRNDEVARRYRSPLTNPTPLRKTLTAFEESDGEEAAWLVAKQTIADAVGWAKRMVDLVEDMIVDLDPAERGRLANWLRSSRDEI